MKNPSIWIFVALSGIALAATAATPSGPGIARPAIRIEPAAPQASGAAAVGTGPMVIRWAEWMSDATFNTDSQGEISAIARLDTNYELVSVFHDDLVMGSLQPRVTTQVGDPIDPHALQPDIQGGADLNLDPSYWATPECFVPIYLLGPASNAPGGIARHVCAFARVKIEPTTLPGSPPGQIHLRITKLRNAITPGSPWIALRNAHDTFDGSQATGVFPGGPYDWTDLRRRLDWLPSIPMIPALADSSVYVRD